MSKIETGQHWRHFKGNVYRVLDVVTNEANHEKLVVYQRVDGTEQTKWARPVSEFTEHVYRPEYTGPRFAVLPPDAPAKG